MQTRQERRLAEQARQTEARQTIQASRQVGADRDRLTERMGAVNGGITQLIQQSGRSRAFISELMQRISDLKARLRDFEEVEDTPEEADWEKETMEAAASVPV